MSKTTVNVLHINGKYILDIIAKYVLDINGKSVLDIDICGFSQPKVFMVFVVFTLAKKMNEICILYEFVIFLKFSLRKI
jgi:hypothetical protein